MPTVLRLKGHRFYFYSHEPNEPPHVHVDKGGATLKACSIRSRSPRPAAFARARSMAYWRW
jgi:hypothetical protein